MNILETLILNYSNIDGITTIISDTIKQKIDELFAPNITLRDKIFDFELYTTSETSQEVYQKILTEPNNVSSKDSKDILKTMTAKDITSKNLGKL